MAAAVVAAVVAAGAVGLLPAPTTLRVEGLSQTAVIGISRPAFSFLHASDDEGVNDDGLLHRGLTQVAYRIVVMRNALGAAGQEGGVVWDSGRVVSSNCSVIEFGGAEPLAPFGLYRWQAQWWRSDGA